MAPVGMVGALGWISSPEVGVVSLVVFLVLGVSLLALCARCQRKPTNAYDVNRTTTDGAGGSNGLATTNTGGGNDPAFSTWRDHKGMPASTLERPKAYAN